MNYPLGMDLSHWDGAVDWEQTKRAGIDFAFCKCTQGISFFDNQYTRNMQQASLQNILRGAYHYYISASPPIDQARWFASHIEDCELSPVIDLEDTVSIPSGFAVRILIFLTELERIVSKRPIIYTSSGFWNSYMAGAMDWGDRYPLWIANYRSDAGPLTPLPWAPTNWTFWQFTKNGKAAKYGSRKASVDLNVFNGSLLELREFCGLPDPVTEITYPIRPERITSVTAGAYSDNAYIVRN